MLRYYHLIKNIRNWWIYLLYKFFYYRKEPLIFKSRKGLLIEVPRRLLHTFKEIFMDECYMNSALGRMSSNALIIDIGANVGYFTLFAEAKIKQSAVLAYEPIPVNYLQLARHQELNRNFNIKCFPIAVAGYNGEIKLSFDSTDSFTTSATMLSCGIGSPDIFSVLCVTLQDIFNDNHIEKCDLLKMDCEGAEYDILYSCPADILKRICRIAMEVHQGKGENENIEAMISFLKQQGFSTRCRKHRLLWAYRR